MRVRLSLVLYLCCMDLNGNFTRTNKFTITNIYQHIKYRKSTSAPYFCKKSFMYSYISLCAIDLYHLIEIIKKIDEGTV